MKVCHLNLYAKEQTNDTTLFYSTAADHYSSEEDRARLARELGDCVREYTPEYINNIIRTANENGFFVAYNHPRWSLENYSHYSRYEGLWGVEIYNTACYLAGLNEYDINIVDDILRDGKRVFASCGDDNHAARHCGGSFVMVNTDDFSYNGIITALLNGTFYSSTGPEIYELWVEDNVVHVTCSAAKQISFTTEGRRAASKRAAEALVTEAEFTLQEDDGYFRIEIIDADGNRANSQAYFLADLT